MTFTAAEAFIILIEQKSISHSIHPHVISLNLFPKRRAKAKTKGAKINGHP